MPRFPAPEAAQLAVPSFDTFCPLLGVCPHLRATAPVDARLFEIVKQFQQADEPAVSELDPKPALRSGGQITLLCGFFRRCTQRCRHPAPTSTARPAEYE